MANVIIDAVKQQKILQDFQAVVVNRQEPKSVPPTEVSTVEHPKHYTFGQFEVIEVLEDWFPTDPLLWQVGKYIARASHKGKQLEDLKKAKWYLERRIDNLEFEMSNK